MGPIHCDHADTRFLSRYIIKLAIASFRQPGDSLKVHVRLTILIQVSGKPSISHGLFDRDQVVVGPPIMSFNLLFVNRISANSE